MVEDKHGNEIRTPDSNAYSDPTYNVLQLVNASVKRIDDIRDLETKANRKEKKSIRRELKLHVKYGEKLSRAESNRIDAIRQVDVAAAQTERDGAGQRALVLANQLTTSAETLRALVASTAATIAAQMQQTNTQFAERITQLEKAQYEKTGLAGVPPEILIRLTALEKVGNTNTGKDTGQEFSSLRLIMIIGLVVSMVGMLMGAYKIISG